jgi:DNA-binding GntR family transcriptional regulator
MRPTSTRATTPRSPRGRATQAASLKERVLQVLRQDIASGALGQGVRLVEVELCQRLRVSRTPLREALRQLEAEGLVVVEPHKGARVSRKSHVELWEHYRIYAALQGLAGELAVPHLTPKDTAHLTALQTELELPNARIDAATWIAKNSDFHKLFVERAASPSVNELLQRQAQYLSRFWPLGLHAPGVLEVSFEQHRRIVALAAEGRGPELRGAVEEHFLDTGRMLLAHAGTLYAL